MTSIFLELQLQGLNHPRNKREVENSEHRAILLKMIDPEQKPHKALCACADDKTYCDQGWIPLGHPSCCLLWRLWLAVCCLTERTQWDLRGSQMR